MGKFLGFHPIFKGASLTIAVGRWAKPHIGFGNYSVRICLGFIALTVYTLDIEAFITYLIQRGKTNG